MKIYKVLVSCCSNCPNLKVDVYGSYCKVTNKDITNPIGNFPLMCPLENE